MSKRENAALPHPVELLEVVRSQSLPLLDEGFSSEVYRVGEHVLKVTKSGRRFEQAAKLSQRMSEDHARTEHFLGAYTPPTKIDLVNDDLGTCRVGVVQPFIEGEPLAGVMENPETDKIPILYFLGASLEMYRHTQVMPDIAHLERRLFKFGTTPNVIVPTITGDPVLVDTNRGKLQSHRVTGRSWSMAIAIRAREAYIRLGQEYPDEMLRLPSVF